MREVAAGLAQRDQGLQARAALGQVFLGEHGLVEAELLHQGAFLRLADLHAQRLDLLFGGRGSRRFVAGQIVLDVRQVDVALGRFLVSLGLAAALGAGGGRGGTGGLGRTANLLGCGAAAFFGSSREVDFVGTVFTFVAAAAFDAAAPVLVAGIAPAFNGFSAAGLVATLFAFFASEGAGFFELGIRPRYDKKRQAGSQARRHTRTAPPARAQARTKTIGKEEEIPQQARCRAIIWCAVLAVIDPFRRNLPLECVALGVGPEVLLSLLPNFASCEALHYSVLRKFQAVSAPEERNRALNSSRRVSSAL